MIIITESASQKFTDHLKQPENNRMFFSGKFGTGKSYFLKNYFKDREEEYDLFWLSPINYVVGANQDIFEWIKIDIAKQLVSKQLFSKEKNDFSDNLILQTYLYSQASSLFSKLMHIVVSSLAKTKTGVDILDKFKSNYEEYKNYKEKVKEGSKTDETNMLSFLNDSFQIKGSIFEDNITTQIIRASIEYVKFKSKSKKKTVIIIDDLDRLDPEHIFRILNILSAHNDHFDSNKFGFEKVILVCDIENIENLYKHRYGEKADFEGYIEKFYTYEPFYFSIKDSILHYCNRQLFIDNMDADSRSTFAYLLHIYCSFNLINTRSLKKILSTPDLVKNINFPKKTIALDKGKYKAIYNQFVISHVFIIDHNSMHILKAFVLLGIAFGGLDKLKAATQSILSKTNIEIDSDNLQSVKKVLTVISHIAKNKNESNAFYSSKLYEHNGIEQDNAKGVFMGNRYEMEIRWNGSMTYEGSSEHYFKDCVIAFMENNDGTNQISQLLQECIFVIDYIISENLFHNVKGVS